MKRLVAGVAIAFICSAAAADDIPLPRPRPPRADMQFGAPPLFIPADLLKEPSACLIGLQQTAEVDPIDLLNGEAGCGDGDMVRLKAVVMPDRSKIAIAPPAELRCPMAASIVSWLRDGVAPRFVKPALSVIANYDAYECRARNRVFGARLSEHARGNALDIRAFILADGKAVMPTDPHVDHGLREQLRSSACALFATVLGPGSDGHHEGHIHLDLAERRSGYRMCQWVVRDPPPPEPAVPLPRARPLLAAAGND